jgi:hypothetical protein
MNCLLLLTVVLSIPIYTILLISVASFTPNPPPSSGPTYGGAAEEAETAPPRRTRGPSPHHRNGRQCRRASPLPPKILPTCSLYHHDNTATTSTSAFASSGSRDWEVIPPPCRASGHVQPVAWGRRLDGIFAALRSCARRFLRQLCGPRAWSREADDAGGGESGGGWGRRRSSTAARDLARPSAAAPPDLQSPDLPPLA